MENNNTHAVLTGDLFRSSELSTLELRDLLDSFVQIEQEIANYRETPLYTFRGDSFQVVIRHPDEALGVSLLIRGLLRGNFIMKIRDLILDARIGIGIGAIDFLTKDRPSLGDGEAFRLSGKMLDDLKIESKSRELPRLRVSTPWPSLNEELDVCCAMIDILLDELTSEQLQAMAFSAIGLKQEDVAIKLAISQSAVSYRLQSDRIRVILKLQKLYQLLLNQALQRILV